MFSIRRGVFETNSSSSHSVVMTKSCEFHKEDVYDYDEKKHCISFWSTDDLEFGRSPFEVLHTVNDKLRYVLASFAGDDEKFKEILDVMREYLDDPDLSIQFPEKDWGDSSPFYGYVDHQSMSVLDSFLKKNSVSVRDFLLQEKFIVIIDGDEYQEWNKLKRVGLINMENIVAEEE